MIATGADDAAIEAATAAVRAQIAFYGSTPAYQVVLDVHGWGDLQPRAARPAPGRATGPAWPTSSTTTCSTPSPSWPRPTRSPPRSRAATARVLDRVALNAPYAADPDLWQQIAADLRDATGGSRRGR